MHLRVGCGCPVGEVTGVPGGRFLLTAHSEVPGWPASSCTGPRVCRRISLCRICTLSERDLLHPPPALSPPVPAPTPDQEGTERGAQEGLSEHLGKVKGPRSALHRSRTAPDTRDASGHHRAPWPGLLLQRWCVAWRALPPSARRPAPLRGAPSAHFQPAGCVHTRPAGDWAPCWAVLNLPSWGHVRVRTEPPRLFSVVGEDSRILMLRRKW